MKKIFVLLLAGALPCCVQLPLIAQSFKEHSNKEFLLSNNPSHCTLLIYNINGFIKVEGYAGDKVMIETEETISAADSKSVEKGKNEFKLGFDQNGDSITAYIAAPYDSHPHDNFNADGGHRKIDYHYHVDYIVKVPYAMNLHISTVNEGEVTVNNVNGVLHVSNVNASVTLTNVKGTTNAHTVNGNITINYLTNPLEQSSFHTINGNINVSFQPDLSADLQFKSMHGEFYTDFPDAVLLPVSVSKKQETKGGDTIYKINKLTVVRLGKGGKTFEFETLNGNVYIKKQA